MVGSHYSFLNIAPLELVAKTVLYNRKERVRTIPTLGVDHDIKNYL